jgi:hypothetical protein
MKRARHQKLPKSGDGREMLRAKGQFWTPDWAAEFVVAYALQNQPRQIFDPAFGEGVFFRAAKRYAAAHHFDLTLFGRDIDPDVLVQARQAGLSDADFQQITFGDFVLDPPAGHFPAIVANPPYIRHHRLAAAQKAALREFARKAIGRTIDGRAGLHVYFLIRALQTLSPGGRLCYIVSADICEGVFSQALWQWIVGNYKIDAVITFSADATPFPDVDTNAVVFCIQHAAPPQEFSWIKCLRTESEELAAFLSGELREKWNTIEVQKRYIDEALATGFSRPPQSQRAARCTLGDFASVKRGIATGDNDFFFMTLTQATELGIPESLLIKAVGRMRDVEGEVFAPEDMERLERSGRPTRLLNVNGFPFAQLPAAVQDYLKEGERQGVNQKTLIRLRKPWYRMETRKIPPILFAYLGRRNTRFIKNSAGVVPLTCLLCVYPKHEDVEFVERLWRILSNPQTVDNLRAVGKSYGGDAIKVEPRALERLPLPDALVEAEGLERYRKPQQSLLDFFSGEDNRRHLTERFLQNRMEQAKAVDKVLGAML